MTAIERVENCSRESADESAEAKFSEGVPYTEEEWDERLRHFRSQ